VLGLAVGVELDPELPLRILIGANQDQLGALVIQELRRIYG
jgi:hypothetical protein